MNGHGPQDRLVEDARAKQENVLWPNAMVNSSGVDALLWKGSPSATRVQRIGIAIFGLAFAFIGTVCELGAYEKRDLFLLLFGLPPLAVGSKIFFNAFRRKPNRGHTSN